MTSESVEDGDLDQAALHADDGLGHLGGEGGPGGRDGLAAELGVAANQVQQILSEPVTRWLQGERDADALTAAIAEAGDSLDDLVARCRDV